MDPVAAAPGNGTVKLLGADDTDYQTIHEAEVALAFIRLRAVELCTWLLGTPKIGPSP